MNEIGAMHHRLINAAPCRIKFLDRKPPCFPYGVLFITGNEENGFSATFGDLTIPVSVCEIFRLLELAEGPIIAKDTVETRRFLYHFRYDDEC